MYWCLRWSSFLHASWSSFDGTIIVSSIIQETELEDYYQTSWGPQTLILFIFLVYHIYQYSQYTQIFPFEGGRGGQKNLILKKQTLVSEQQLFALSSNLGFNLLIYIDSPFLLQKRNIPIGSMYGVLTYIQVISMVSMGKNVGTYASTMDPMEWL